MVSSYSAPTARRDVGRMKKLRGIKLGSCPSKNYGSRYRALCVRRAVEAELLFTFFFIYQLFGGRRLFDYRLLWLD